MPTNYSLVIEPFDVWGFDYMGPFRSTNGYTHILVDVDNITKWVVVPIYLMTDGGSHFIHGAFRKLLAKYDVNHRIASTYHPQFSGQVE